MKSFMIFGMMILFFGLVQSIATYTTTDTEKSLRSFALYLLNATNEYFKVNPKFPDMLDNEKRFEHLGLVNGKWIKVTPNFTAESIRNFIIDSASSIILTRVSYPLTYELDCDFVYNYLLLPIYGKAIIKGTIAEIQFGIKFYNSLTPKKFAVETMNVKPIFTFTSANLTTTSPFAKYFNLQSLVENLFKNNMQNLNASFAAATNSMVKQIFSKVYPESEVWNFTVIGNPSKWSIYSSFENFTLNSANNLVAFYTTPTITFPESVPWSAQLAQQGKIRTISLGMDIIKLIMDKVYKDSSQYINNRNLPEEIQNRLDMQTFLKLMPDAAINSIAKHGLENNDIDLSITPHTKLEYILDNKNYTCVNATYNYSFVNQGRELLEGNVTISIQFVATWTKEGSLGYLNFKAKEIKVIGLNYESKTYPVISDAFKSFLNEVSEFLFSRMKDAELISKGIPIRDTLTPYEQVEVYWNKSSSQIVIEQS